MPELRAKEPALPAVGDGSLNKNPLALERQNCDFHPWGHSHRLQFPGHRRAARRDEAFNLCSPFHTPQFLHPHMRG